MFLKKFFPATLAVWPYLIAPLFTDMLEAKTGSAYLSVYLLLTVLIFIANILFACLCRNVRDLALWNMLIKLSHIPFYLAVFVLGIGVMILIPVLLLIDALLLTVSSVYGIRAVLGAKRQGLLSPGKAVLHVLLHLLFVADVVSSIVVYRKIAVNCFHTIQQNPNEFDDASML